MHLRLFVLTLLKVMACLSVMVRCRFVFRGGHLVMSTCGVLSYSCRSHRNNLLEAISMTFWGRCAPLISVTTLTDCSQNDGGIREATTPIKKPPR
jgi:hypothetical protein